MRGIGTCGVPLAPAVAGGRHPHQARVQRVLDVALAGCRPRSARCAGSALPSSSTLSEPRRSGMCRRRPPSRPWRATRSPMRPANALEPLRLKSPSRPWPIASCSRMPGQPGPSTTRHLAGRGRARLEVGERGVHRVVDVALDHVVGEVAEAEAPAAAAGADLAAAVLCSAITVTDRRTSGRTSAASVPSARATSTTSYSPPGRPSPASRAGPWRARAARPFEQLRPWPCCRAWRSGRSARRATRLGATLRAADLDACRRAPAPRWCAPCAPRRAASFGDVVGIGERGLLAG